jgi:hypothetical protein
MRVLLAVGVVVASALGTVSATQPTGAEYSSRAPHVPITWLPLSTNAACLDGSPFGFFHVPSTTNSTKWTLYFQGGGWCTDEASCYGRSLTALGSSKHFPNASGCQCYNTCEDAAACGLDDTCNCLYLPYCDGASFGGYRDGTWPAPGGQPLHFRGLRNLDATIDFAFASLGLGRASEMVVTGSSAGGLAAFLHADRVANRLGADVRTTAAPFVGFFLDHKRFPANESSSTVAPAASPSSGTGEALMPPGRGNSNAAYPRDSDYGAWMKYITTMQALEAAGGLSPACLAAYPSTPHFCFMSPHMQRFVKTPFFMFNSKVDAWQMCNILQLPCYGSDDRNHTTVCNATEQESLVDYGSSFLSPPNVGAVEHEPQNGAFITSCVCHGCPWYYLRSGWSDNRTSFEHYADWHQGRTKGAAALHVDRGPPNGGGVLHKQFPGYPGCLQFP